MASGMKSTLIMFVAAMVLAGTALAGSAAGPADAVCPQDTHAFTGTARDLTVPAGGYCQITGATITRDLIQQDNAGADISKTRIGRDVVFGNYAGAGITDSSIGHDVLAAGAESGADLSGSTVGHDYVGSGPGSGTVMLNTKVGHDVKFLAGAPDTTASFESTTIGHDFYASQPETIQTGHNDANTPGGPVFVGHDFTIDGSPNGPFVFDGLCNLTVGNDLTIRNRTVDLGFGVGNCARSGQPNDTIGRDLIITGNNAVSGPFPPFGPSSLNIVGNHVGRDLVFSHNTAVPGSQLEVSGNVAGRDATCSANTPAITVNSPNTAGRSNSCV